MKKKILVRLCLVCLALVTVLSFAGCSAARTVRASSNAKKVVATAGDLEILYDEYYYLAMTRLQQLKLEYGEDAMSNPEAREKMEKFLAENLLTESHALLAIGLSLGIDISKGSIAESVDAQMEEIIAETFAGDRDAYIESLREGYLTDRYIRTFVAVENYLSVEVIKVLLENGALDDSDEAAMVFLNGDDFIRVRQVYIESAYAGGDEKARAKAEALHATVAAATTDEARNEAMLSVMSESRDFNDVGNGHYFARGEMTPDYEATVFALSIYGVSEVIEVDGGYAFVMRLPKDEQYMKDNLEELKGKTYYVVLNQMIDEWLAENPLMMTSFGESLDPAALEAIEPDGGEGWLIAIPLIAGGAAVILAIFVIRVLMLRSKMKKKKANPAGKPLYGGKTVGDKKKKK
jgi:parvulin-like peptidyl-prolyl isomerase